MCVHFLDRPFLEFMIFRGYEIVKHFFTSNRLYGYPKPQNFTKIKEIYTYLGDQMHL
jgi:hypothetical protein